MNRPSSGANGTKRIDDYRSDLVHVRRPDFKRLIVSCDGTWLNSTSGASSSTHTQPSNATRITRAIRPQSSDGIKQIIYYSHGVGSTGGVIDRFYGGVTGEGLAEMVREAYSFLCTNYEPNDEIFLFGFSRGAFTARTIAGLVDEIGVLSKTGLQYLPEIYRDVRNRRNPSYQPKDPNKPFRNKPSAGDPRYRKELQRRRYTTLGVTIKAVCVWETVGALGTPRIGWLEKLGLQGSVSRELSFADTDVAGCIEHAFQALALDERRSAFRPALWEKAPGNTTTRLRQVWFPGVHSNVGGGYEDQGLANITLAWMIGCVQPFLDVDPDYVLDEQERAEATAERVGERPRPWSFGRIYNSMAGLYTLGGASQRTPGRYFAVEAGTGRETDRPLRRTCEYIHPSVRVRYKLRGPAPEDKGVYDAPALKEWKLMIEPALDDEDDDDEDDDDDHDGNGAQLQRKPDIFWDLRSGQTNVTARELPEASLRPLERELLEMDPDRALEEYVLRPDLARPSDHPPPRRKSGGRGGGGGEKRQSSGSKQRRDSRVRP